ncbi:MAG: hypothetical protein AAFN81_11165 [Bacteroidota bacterium]
MFLSKEFEKSLYAITALAVFASLYYLTLFALGVRHDYTESEPSLAFYLLNIVPQLLLIGGFWFGVFYLTGEKTGSLIAGILHIATNIYIVFAYHSAGVHSSSASMNAPHWINILGLLMAVSVFATIQYKSWKKIRIFLLLFFIMYGMKVSAFHYFYSLEKILEISGWRDPLSLTFSLGEGRTTNINLLATLTSNFFLPVWLICFWYLHRIITSGKEFAPKFLSLPSLSNVGRLSFSIIHWTFRIVLFGLIFGSAARVNLLQRTSSLTHVLIWVVCLMVTIYLLAVIYRNLLAAYFKSRAAYPAWNYFLLHIPIIHFFAWLKAVSLPKSSVAVRQNGVLTGESTSPQAELAELQSRFTLQGRNRGIVTLIVISACLVGLVNIIEFDSPRFNGGQALIGVTSIILSLAILAWFIRDSKALYSIFIIGISLVLIASFFESEVAVSPVIIAALVNYPIYYVLFHYDQFTIEQEVESSPDGELPTSAESGI